MVFKSCDKKDLKSHGKNHRYWWLFPITGLLALIWYLIRVVPKPSRASYPCQRAAAPLAGSFVLWFLGVLGSITLFRKARIFFKQPRMRAAMIYLVLLVVVGIATLVNLPEKPVIGANPGAISPVGAARGIHPGRVVWAYDPNATDWDGYHSPEHWWENDHTSLPVVEELMSQVIRGLTGKSTEAAAWEAIFRYHNQTRGRGNIGYQPGEKITIKLNLSTCSASGNYVDPETYDKKSDILNRVDTSPQMVLALLRQLVNTVGAAQEDITVGDPTALFPNQYWNLLHPEFPRVHYWDNYGGSGRTRAEFSNIPFYWSTPAAQGKLQDFLPTAVAEADYLIDFAVLKGHSAGVSVCAKNHYGSLIRCPHGYLRDKGILDYYNTHLSLPNAVWSPGLGKYRSLVDLMGHPEIGGKTLLYLIDGLYGGYYWNAEPVKWTSSPFKNGSGDWPSSLFGSQDPLAIDSVAYDFLLEEWPEVVLNGDGASLQGGAEDYLHEAAQADNPPSGTLYDPDHDGTAMSSLGVHEHWNNPTNKMYSRNLGTGDGIELFRVYNLTGNPSKIALTRSQLNFSYVRGGINPGPQSFLITNAATGDTSWVVDEDTAWLSCTPTSGNNPVVVTVSVNPAGMRAGVYSGAITVTNLNSTDSPLTVAVNLTIFTPGSDAAPFGCFETPLNNSRVFSSIPVTGWVLDDVAVDNVKIYFQSGENLIYIGDAVLVEGARPDVETAYPTYPFNYKAGWGYMLLTNFLPNGNGTFILHATAADSTGHYLTLGTRTISVDNAHAVKPFGAIDTPTQGGTASGSSFKNWGWALTPQPNSIPTNGSTITIWVDGVSLGHPVYNIYRPDIAALFPGYANCNGAVGYFYLDTTVYANGVHTISWSAADNAGNLDGIGSRYFTIQNTGSTAEHQAQGAGTPYETPIQNPNTKPQHKLMCFQRGYNPKSKPETLYPDENGQYTIEIKELERLVIYLEGHEIQSDSDEYKKQTKPYKGFPGESRGEPGVHPAFPDSHLTPNPEQLALKNTLSALYHGYLVNGSELKLLPIGSTLDSIRGVFYWQPGPGFLGEYRLFFMGGEKGGNFTRKSIKIIIVPRHPG